MNVLVTGSSGLIGSALVSLLARDGHAVRRLVRSSGKVGPDSFLWDPAAGTIDSAALADLDATVHLAGETVAGRWTAAKKRSIRESRVASTRLLSEALAGLERAPKVLVSASASGFYGNRGDELLTEASGPGKGFLADVVREWEAASERLRDAGIRVVSIRSGIVLSRSGGALERMLPPFRLGLGGPLGDGRQYMSWIALEDEVRAIRHALVTESLSGPVNLVAPNPVTNRDFAKTLGRVLRRPAVLPTPMLPLRLLFGKEFVEETLLSSARVLPERLDATGFPFEHPELEEALRETL